VVLFTSAGDYSQTRNFVTCPSNKRLLDDVFAIGEPDNKKGTELCTVLRICADCNNSGYMDVPCGTSAKVLCQVI
jgi:hypothetical protein